MERNYEKVIQDRRGLRKLCKLNGRSNQENPLYGYILGMGVSTEKSLKARMFTFEGSRQEVRVQTVSAAFDAILETIQVES